MIRKLIAAAASLALLVAAPAIARPFLAKDLAMLDRVSDVHVSPDGRWIAWNQRSTDWDGNRGVNALMLLDRTKAGARPITVSRGEKAPVNPRWSSDGQLYFLSVREGGRQLYRLSPTSPALTQVTRVGVDIDLFRLSADGRTVVISAGAYPDCPNLACNIARDSAKKAEKATGQVYDATTYRFWDTWSDGKRALLFAAAIDPQSDTAITDVRLLTLGLDADVPAKPSGGDDSFAVSGDGKTVWFAARPSGASQGLGDPDSLYVVPADGSAKPRLLHAVAKDVTEGSLALSPDGSRLAFVRAPRGGDQKKPGGGWVGAPK
jgi:dipeptidyl aminopeptidase/acylaminoacyl peptidase